MPCALERNGHPSRIDQCPGRRVVVVVVPPWASHPWTNKLELGKHLGERRGHPDIVPDIRIRDQPLDRHATGFAQHPDLRSAILTTAGDPRRRRPLRPARGNGGGKVV